ncbi:MAG: sigma-70 family RNA polymerase sigma factor [Candidatus Latescibacterota bacterium]|jgi:RNA polymerase sigma-70 factor (ECF subfamily)
MIEPDRADVPELVARCQRGDHLAFGELVRREQQRVCQLAYRILGNSSELDDVVQEVFMAVYRRLSTFRGEAHFSTWVTRIAVNVCRRTLRRRRFSRLLFGPDLEREDAGRPLPLTVLEREEEARALTGAVADLPEKLRLVVILRYYEELPCEEVAAALGCNVGTVRSRLFNARQQLKERMLAWEQE